MRGGKNVALCTPNISYQQDPVIVWSMDGCVFYAHLLTSACDDCATGRRRGLPLMPSGQPSMLRWQETTTTRRYISSSQPCSSEQGPSSMLVKDAPARQTTSCVAHPFRHLITLVGVTKPIFMHGPVTEEYVQFGISLQASAVLFSQGLIHCSGPCYSGKNCMTCGK